MYISKKDREIIYNKFDGKCAYSGTKLESDWQVDHLKPIRRNWWENSALFEEDHKLNNMFPSQGIINHYKFSLSIEEFRDRIATLHVRLKKLPKNPRSERSIKRKQYLLKVASYFGITEDAPFTKNFYFETYNKK